jgi:hypothetical protein
MQMEVSINVNRGVIGDGWCLSVATRNKEDTVTCPRESTLCTVNSVHLALKFGVHLGMKTLQLLDGGDYDGDERYNSYQLSGLEFESRQWPRLL